MKTKIALLISLVAYLYRIAARVIEPERPLESTGALGPMDMGRTTITFPEGFAIESLCFVDDHSYLILLTAPDASHILKLPNCNAPTSRLPLRGVDAVFDQVRMASANRAEALQDFTNSFQFRVEPGGGMYDWSADASVEVSFDWFLNLNRGILIIAG